MVSTALINHLKQLNKDRKFPLLHETLNIFGEQLNDESFTKWLSCKLQIRHSKFNEYHSNNKVVIEEVKIRPGQTYYSANCMVVTCTISSIQDKLSQQGILAPSEEII